MGREARIVKPRFIAGLILIAILFSAIATIFIPKQNEFPVSELERIALKEYSAKYANYLEEIDRTGDADKDNQNNPIINNFPLDRYIAYALEYSYNENDKSELTVKEIKKFLESVFDAEFKEEEINNVGISPLLLDKNVNHDPVSKVYSIQKTTDKRQIAAIPITKYIRKKHLHQQRKNRLYYRL